MSDIQMTELLARMRSLAAEASRGIDAAPPREPQTAGFANTLNEAVNNITALQKRASGMARAFEKGDPNVNLAEVMVAAQKASVSFQAMTHVRNKLIRAYQEVMKMPI